MKALSFGIKNFKYTKSEDEIDVSFLSPLLRRKLSLLDKAVLSVAVNIRSENISQIVYASEYGEFSRLDSIIEQYLKDGEVSPVQFSASVHNYPVSFFTQYKKLNIPYYALSAGENTLFAALTKSIISKSETLLIYADVYDGIKSVSAIISPEGSSCKYSNGSDENSSFNDFIDFLEKKSDVFSSNFGIITRI